jgi:hypothetical protein
MGDDIEAMDIREKEEHVHNILTGCIDNITKEYNITYSQMIGILELIKAGLINECNYEEEDDEQNDKV